jgi:hypothetical protein
MTRVQTPFASGHLLLWRLCRDEPHVRPGDRFKASSRKIGAHMSTYRIHTIGRDGRLSGTKAVECVDDEEAVAKV